MIGGVFEGAAVQDGPYTALHTVTTASDQGWTTVLVEGAAAHRFLCYRSPDGGCCNVGEIEFRGPKPRATTPR